MRKLVPFLVLISLCSCTAISSLVHDDQVVAKVGDVKLYRSELNSYIPDFASPEDSANLATQYINSWAKEILYLKVAEKQLSKSETDVSAELEAYRRSLMKYRFEQHYINDRLDTLVTEDQIAEYYASHQDAFKIDRPILKVRFLDVMKDSPNYDELREMLSCEDFEVRSETDSLVFSSALRYFDASDVWMDAIVLAKEFGVDYGTMLSTLDKSYITIESEDRGDVRMAYVCDIMRKGVAPVEFCSAKIRDIILSVRKRDLIDSLERDLLDEALEHKQLVIY